ncbi:glycosyltransferase family 4 protein [Alkalimarinus coralli]|uniref:glycosyltransferase family 4 protein n=1 Tax=Alkalimarinus coralli TaxID=2935863 RepID=UPI00202B485F|nr:glycosyltransferase family 4 protein [Alkalimarinus coralli]
MKNMLFAINVDWYFNLHWKDRIFSRMTKGLKTQVCYSKTEEYTVTNDDIETITYSLHRSSINPVSNLKTFLSCIKIVNNSQPSIIHSVTVKPNLFFGLIARSRKIPILITIPGLGSVFSTGSLKFSVYRKIILFLYKVIAKNNCYFVFENPSDKRLFTKLSICAPQNSALSPGAGIDLSKFKFNADIASPDNKIRVLFAARLIYGKGLEDLIKAIDLLNQKRKIFQLDVAGIIDAESPESIPQSQISYWQQAGKINWLGQVEDIPGLLKEVNIVALPTRYAEGLPRILLEAASAGRAIVTTDNPGCNSLIKHNYNGQLVAPRNIEQLASALQVYQDRDLRLLHGHRARQSIEEKFTIDFVIDCYKEAYDFLLKNERKSKQKQL